MSKRLALVILLAFVLTPPGLSYAQQANRTGSTAENYRVYLPLVSYVKYLFKLYPIADGEIRCCGKYSYFGALEWMGAGYDLDLSTQVRTLLRFEDAPLPPDLTVGKATLYLYFMYWYGYPNQTRTVEVSRLLSDWDEGSVEWFNQPESAEPAASFTLTTDTRSFGYKAVDITSLIQDLQHHDVENYGLVLTSDESPTTNPIVFRFSSVEGEHPPYLIIDCTPEGR